MYALNGCVIDVKWIVTSDPIRPPRNTLLFTIEEGGAIHRNDDATGRKQYTVSRNWKLVI